VSRIQSAEEEETIRNSWRSARSLFEAWERVRTEQMAVVFLASLSSAPNGSG